MVEKQVNYGEHFVLFYLPGDSFSPHLCPNSWLRGRLVPLSSLQEKYSRLSQWKENNFLESAPVFYKSYFGFCFGASHLKTGNSWRESHGNSFFDKAIGKNHMATAAMATLSDNHIATTTLGNNHTDIATTTLGNNHTATAS